MRWPSIAVRQSGRSPSARARISGGPPWSVRVSLANLNDEDYAQIGNYMRKAAEQYVEAWQAETKARPKKART